MKHANRVKNNNLTSSASKSVSISALAAANANDPPLYSNSGQVSVRQADLSLSYRE